MEHSKYEIKTINDLIDVAGQTENTDSLFIDLRAFVEVALQLKSVMPPVEPLDFTWIDDNKHEATIQIKIEGHENECYCKKGQAVYECISCGKEGCEMCSPGWMQDDGGNEFCAECWESLKDVMAEEYAAELWNMKESEIQHSKDK